MSAHVQPKIESPLLLSPNAEQVDAHAVEYKRLEKILDAAKAELAKVRNKEGADLDKLHGTLIEMVRSFGGKHAEKSKILHGIEWELMATFGQSAGIDSAAVERLRLALESGQQDQTAEKVVYRRKILSPGAGCRGSAESGRQTPG